MLTKEQLAFLNSVCPNVWTEENGIVGVNGDVDITNTNLTQIPVQFGQVTGVFKCYANKLTTVKGFPSIIESNFNCNLNQFASLTEGPKKVTGFYSCSRNKLTSLIGAPKTHNHNFICEHNQLTSLEGCPRIIKYNLYCADNPHLKYLWGIGRVEGEVYYDNYNEINEWIISSARKDIIFPHFTLEENIDWIKTAGHYSCLLRAPKEIRRHFSSKILHLADSGIC